MPKLERGFIALIGLLLLFIIINFDSFMGTVFSVMAIFATLLLLADPRIRSTIERKYEPQKQIITAIVGILLVYGLSSIAGLIIPEVKQILGLSSVVKLFAQTTPFFAGSALFAWFAYSVGVGSIETWSIWGPTMEFFTEWMNKILTMLGRPRITNISGGGFQILKNKFVLSVIVLFGAGFSLLHLTAKGGSPQDLIIVFIMGCVTGAMVFYEKLQTKSAMLMHIGLNSVAMLISTGLLTMLPAFVASLVVISLIAYSTKYIGGLPTRLRY